MSEIMATDLASSPDGMRIARAIEYLTDNFEMQPSLDDAAREAGLSSYHFQRMFTRFVGISPKKFVQHLTLNRAKESLAASASVLDAAYGAGLSGPGRLHDLFVTHESLTPGEWKSKGAGKDIVYGWHPSPFGDCLIVASERGVCGLAFELEDGRDATIDNLFRSLGEAVLRTMQRQAVCRPSVQWRRAKCRSWGTPFQLKVWEGLLRIPTGEVTSYEGLATSLGRPPRRARSRCYRAKPYPGWCRVTAYSEQRHDHRLSLGSFEEALDACGRIGNAGGAGGLVWAVEATPCNKMWVLISRLGVTEWFAVQGGDAATGGF